jgi:hypothetical protein
MAGLDHRNPMAIATPTWPLPDFFAPGGESARIGYSLDLGVTSIETEVVEIFEQAIASDRPGFPPHPPGGDRR